MRTIWKINARERIDSDNSKPFPEFFLVIEEDNQTVVGESAEQTRIRIEAQLRHTAHQIINSHGEPERTFNIDVKRVGYVG